MASRVSRDATAKDLWVAENEEMSGESLSRPTVLVAMSLQPNHPSYQKFGDTNVAAHRRLLAAARRGDIERVRKLTVEQIDEAEHHLHRLDAEVRRHFVFDSERRSCGGAAPHAISLRSFP
jgi:hypothetical protein